MKYLVRVLVPVTDVWLGSALGPNQYAQVSFHNKPTQRDIKTLLALIELCRDSVLPDAVPQVPVNGVSTGSSEPAAGFEPWRM